MQPTFITMLRRWQKKPPFFFLKPAQKRMPSEPRHAEVLNTAFQCRAWHKKPPKRCKRLLTAVHEAKRRGRFDLAQHPRAIRLPSERGVCLYLGKSMTASKKDSSKFRHIFQKCAIMRYTLIKAFFFRYSWTATGSIHAKFRTSPPPHFIFSPRRRVPDRQTCQTCQGARYASVRHYRPRRDVRGD